MELPDGSLRVVPGTLTDTSVSIACNTGYVPSLLVAQSCRGRWGRHGLGGYRL